MIFCKRARFKVGMYATIERRHILWIYNLSFVCSLSPLHPRYHTFSYCEILGNKYSTKMHVALSHQTSVLIDLHALMISFC